MAKRFDVFSVKEATPEQKKAGKKNFWNKLGTAFENSDGSLSVLLDGLPIDGKLQIRAHVPKESSGESFE